MSSAHRVQIQPRGIFHAVIARGVMGIIQQVPQLFPNETKERCDSPVPALSETSGTTPVSIQPREVDNSMGSTSIQPAVRLIQLTLAGRAEGIVSAVKDSYGFIQYAERPVDVLFKLYQV
jgi:hypothetical protein